MNQASDMRLCKRCGRSVLRNECRPSRKGGHVCLDCLRTDRRKPSSVAGRAEATGRKRRIASPQVLGDVVSVVLVGLLAAFVLMLYWALF